MEIDDEVSALLRMLGEEVALKLVCHVTVWREMLNSGPRLEIELKKAFARPIAAVRADLLKIAKASKVLADLLYPMDTLHRLTGRAVSDQFPYRDKTPSEVRARLQRLSTEARCMEELATRTADRLKVQRGPRPKDLQRMLILHQLVTFLAREGIAQSTGENSKLVRISRIICARLELKGDPRDTLRWLVESGYGGMKATQRKPKSMREPGKQPQSVDLGGVSTTRQRKRTP